MESRTRTGQFLAAAIGVAAFALAARALAQAPGTAAVPAAPAEVVAELHAGIVAAAKDPKRSVEQRYAELEPLVARTHDLPYIAELSIRRHWAGLTDDQREHFLAAFVRLSVMTYASRFGAATSSTFEVLGSEDAGNGRVQVHAAIHRANDPDQHRHEDAARIAPGHDKLRNDTNDEPEEHPTQHPNHGMPPSQYLSLSIGLTPS